MMKKNHHTSNIKAQKPPQTLHLQQRIESNHDKGKLDLHFMLSKPENTGSYKFYLKIEEK